LPSEGLHPVALFGRGIGRFDRAWRRPQAVGVLLALVLPLVATAVVGGITAVAFLAHPFAGVAAGGILLFSTVSLRMLLETATQVIALTASEIEEARTSVRALVGRDTDGLSPAELRSAAVESAAENLADGLVGPLLAFTVGAQLSVAVGVAAAAYLKAVNTMDSMLGYRSKAVGTASARLDDVLMWVPARVTAVLLAVVSLDPGALWKTRQWAQEPSSPNSGWPMAAIAAIGSVQLAKPGAYTLNPGAELPSVDAAVACVRVVGAAGVLAFVVAGLLTVPTEGIAW
jgi:adenosylcobinamide-phosphate synthase